MSRLVARKDVPHVGALIRYITMLFPDYYVAKHHETASKFVGQKNFRLNIHQFNRQLDGLPWPIRFNAAGAAHAVREKPMKKLVFAILLIASPALAQTKLPPKSATARADPCVPIGRMADGRLVYSLKCDNLPGPRPPPVAQAAPPPVAATAPPPVAQTAPPPVAAVRPAEPEAQSTGLFGFSFEESGRTSKYGGCR